MSERDRETEQGRFDLWGKVQREMLVPPLLLLPSQHLSVYSILGCQESALPAFPPSKSSLQEIKGFTRRSSVSYGALCLSGIAGSD